MTEKIEKPEEQWRVELTAEQFRVLRQKGTERAFTSPLHKLKSQGVYRCAGCGQGLFSSDAKFDSGTGWPSFYEPIDDKNIETAPDHGLFTSRTEVLCARCGGHLGHVFDDGPPPTSLRYCVNGVALEFMADVHEAGR